MLAISLREDSEEATAFRTGLHEAGYVEGRDISFSWWSGRGSFDQVAAAAAGLIKRKVDVIVVEGAHRNKLGNKFRAHLSGKRIVCLDISDAYDYTDPQLRQY